jgi:hypothetical protein
MNYLTLKNEIDFITTLTSSGYVNVRLPITVSYCYWYKDDQLYYADSTSTDTIKLRMIDMSSVRQDAMFLSAIRKVKIIYKI